MTVDDFAVDRDDFAGIDDDFVADCQLGGRDRGHDAVAQDPGGLVLKFQQLADGAPRPGGGQIADPVAELDQPGDDRCRPSGLPCMSDAAIASVSRKSTLRRPSRRHTRQARNAIG